MQTTKEVNPHPHIAPCVCTSRIGSIFWGVWWSLVCRGSGGAKKGLRFCRENMKLNTHPRKCARFQQHVLYKFSNCNSHAWFYICKIIDCGEFSEEKLCSIVHLVRIVLNCQALLCMKLEGVGSKTLNIAKQYVMDLWDNGSKNLATFANVNFKLHTNLLHVQGVAHHFPTSRVLASRQV